MWPHQLTDVATPGALHHYTSAVGLLGILKSKTLWASDCHLLNDRSELLYGHDLVTNFLTQQAGPVAKAFLRGAPIDKDTTQLYVASFCERGDLLSQWRGYSRSGDGYSLAFRFSSLACSTNVFLTKVLYDRKEQEEVLMDLFRSLADVFTRIDLPSDQTTRLIQFAVEALWSLPFRLKDGHFLGEQEWRLVGGLASGYGEQFRVVDGHFVPYIEIPFDTHALIEIRQGPGAYRASSLTTLRRLLNAEKFPNVEVSKSLIQLI